MLRDGSNNNMRQPPPHLAPLLIKAKGRQCVASLLGAVTSLAQAHTPFAQARPIVTNGATTANALQAGTTTLRLLFVIVERKADWWQHQPFLLVLVRILVLRVRVQRDYLW